jgi:1-acyl-sn-glycerol-3-phosphate acyltransferase
VIVNKPEMLKAKGPLLLAANHPNSFLDGIIMATLMDENIYSLARGDAFKNKKFSSLSKKLNLLPVYRTSEGVENLEHNYTTFAACQEAFASGAVVMIFSEGRCINEWHLRPLKKGTARLAISTWQKDIDLQVVPVGFNYNPFRNFGKNVFINFGQPLDRQEVMQHLSDGKLFQSFNEQLEKQLKELVYEINPADKEKQKELLYIPQPAWKKALLILPAIIGALIHLPLYVFAKVIANVYFGNDHYDSAIATIFLLGYPLYLLLVFIVVLLLMNLSWALLLVLIMPFCWYAVVQLKEQLS